MPKKKTGWQAFNLNVNAFATLATKKLNRVKVGKELVRNSSARKGSSMSDETTVFAFTIFMQRPKY